MNDFDKRREKNQVKSDLQKANWDLMVAGLREIDMKGLTDVEHSMEDITGSLDAS